MKKTKTVHVTVEPLRGPGFIEQLEKQRDYLRRVLSFTLQDVKQPAVEVDRVLTFERTKEVSK